MFSSISRFFSSRNNYYFTVSLIGRPNVGKSTLFNKLVGERRSLVHPTPGLTRDRIEGISSWFGVGLKFVDTAGWDPEDTPNTESIIEKMKEQTRNALVYSDLVMFILNAREGVTKTDLELARFLKLRMKPGYDPKLTIKNVLLVANKAEETFTENISNEVFKLGFGEPIYISANHGDGMVDLYEKLREKIPEEYIQEYNTRIEKRKEKHEHFKNIHKKELLTLEQESGESFNIKEWEKAYDKLNPYDNSDYDSDSEVDLTQSLTTKIPTPSETVEYKLNTNKPIQLSIVGKPNAGKSTLVNKFLREKRVIADNLPGTTRDTVYIEYTHNGRKFVLVDTPGLKKRAEDTISEMLEDDVKRAIRFSHVVILLLDGMKGISPVDLTLARKVLEEGRVLIVVANKWDLIDKDIKEKAAKYFAHMLYTKLDMKSVVLILASAKNGHNLNRIMDEALSLYNTWNKRISTGLLNRWLNAYKKVQNLPSENGAKLNIKFISQIKARPPTFYLYVNDRSLMKENYYKRFTNALCEEFGLKGVPIRILLRDRAKRAVKDKSGYFKIKTKDMMKSSASEIMEISPKKPIMLS